MINDLHRGLGSLSREQLDRVDPEELETKSRNQRPLPAAHSRTERELIELDSINARLNKLDPARQKGRVRKALIDWRASTGAVDDHDQTVRGIRESIDAAKAKLASVIEKQKTGAAEALLAGKSIPDNSAARKAVVRESERIEAGEAARALAEPKRAELEAAERQAHADLADEVHDAIGADALAELSRARKALTAVAPHLARLWAMDLVRDSLLGLRWSFDVKRVRPFSGAAVVRSFVSCLPEMLRVEELGEAALRTAAERMAARIVTDIEETTK